MDDREWEGVRIMTDPVSFLLVLRRFQEERRRGKRENGDGMADGICVGHVEFPARGRSRAFGSRCEYIPISTPPIFFFLLLEVLGNGKGCCLVGREGVREDACVQGWLGKIWLKGIQVTGTRKTNPAIELHDLPRIDLVCLSHYHA